MLITIADARGRVLDVARPLATERVPVGKALDRTLAADVTAAGDVPPFPSSAMDGYAIVHGPADRELTIAGESRAGAPSTSTLEPDQAIRISTGAAVPEGATAVIRQEDTEVHDGRVTLRAAVDAGQNVRFPGEDIRGGTTVLHEGTTLTAAELGAAAAAGAGQLTVFRRPRVAVLCTGDELREPGEPLRPGEIHNSNAPMLAALATRSNAITSPPQILRDDRQQTEQAIEQALQNADVVIISGGVSVGPHDHVKPALKSLGVQEHFWGVSLQPGKPTWFGTRGDTLVFGLPGNPVSAFVTFTLFVKPALAVMQGGTEPEHERDRTATLGEAVRRNPAREQAVRVRLTHKAGETIAIPNGPQGSHVVTSLLGADALAMIPPGDGEVPAGTTVELELLEP